MTEASYIHDASPPAYRVSFTLAYGGRRYARLGALREAGDRLPVLADLLAHILYDGYQVHAEVRGDGGAGLDPSSTSPATGYSATASVVVRGRTAANYAHALACEARIPVSYQKLAEGVTA